MRRIAVAVMALLVVLGQALVASARGPEKASNTRTNWGVTQKLTVHYNLRTCAKTREIQITAVTAKYRRARNDRKVSVAHLRGINNGTDCAGDGYYPDKRTETYHPHFGCSGRCKRDRTEAFGFDANWKFVRMGGEPPFTWVAAAVHGHLTDGAGKKLGNVCTTVELVGGAGCGDL